MKPLFCDSGLAERIERTEARHIAEASVTARDRRADGKGFVIHLAGGVAPTRSTRSRGWASAACRARTPCRRSRTPSPGAALRDLASAGARRYLALHDGVVAGGASFRAVDGVALLGGAATVPALRRRGVQSALLSARLADAADDGCDLAVLTTQPGSKSHHNAQRQGFELLYTRAILTRQR